MTIEVKYRDDGRSWVTTTECGLCGEPISKFAPFQNHLEHGCQTVIEWRDGGKRGLPC